MPFNIELTFNFNYNILILKKIIFNIVCNIRAFTNNVPIQRISNMYTLASVKGGGIAGSKKGDHRSSVCLTMSAIGRNM
jgi:hypothetical protein